MHALNLVEYIQEWLLATQLWTSGIFDAIVYADIAAPDVEATKHCAVYGYDDINMHFGVSGKLHAIIKNHKNTLIIVSSVSILYLLPLMHEISDHCVILNCGAGISGALTKGRSEIYDLDLIKTTGAQIYEASDAMQFFALCKPSDTALKYIRINHLEIPWSLELTWKENYTNILAPVDAQKTMIVSGSLLGLFASALDDNQQGVIDLFTINTYYETFSEELRESIEQTKSLHVVLDASEKSGYIDFLKAQLYTMGIHGLDFYVSTPQRGETATILPEYFWEEVSFS